MVKNWVLLSSYFNLTHAYLQFSDEILLEEIIVIIRFELSANRQAWYLLPYTLTVIGI